MSTQTTPTPERLAQRAVGREIEEAVERAYEALDREIDAGRLVRAEVTKAMQFYPDFADGWSEWNQDAEEEDATAANEADDQQFLPWRDDNPKHRPIWREDGRMWHCTCGKTSADRLRHIRSHVDIINAKAEEAQK